MGSSPLDHLPHGLPFRFVDRILELAPERVVALKNVTGNDPTLTAHFPGNPLMPGVLLLEAMAQTAGLLLGPGASAVLAQVKDARFRRPVIPGDRLRLEARRLGALGRLHRFAVTASVDGEVAAAGELVLARTDEGGSDAPRPGGTRNAGGIGRDCGQPRGAEEAVQRGRTVGVWASHGGRSVCAEIGDPAKHARGARGDLEGHCR